MSYYEFVYFTRQDLSTNQVDEINEKIKKLVEEQEGKVTKVEYWGLRNLAYKVKKNKKAHYCLLNLEISADGLNELKRVISLNERVLRHLVIKVEQLDEKPSVMMKTSKE